MGLCSYEGLVRNVVFASFYFMKVVHESLVSMLGFVVFVFHELVKNLMRKVRFLSWLCVDQLHEVML